ncbi:ADP-ribose 1''-phosphate phosphatase [Orbilia blumenaviensis]|uniref:ADP-ribose 1''-phosphate phosphatase n=1 Tax=Orbilia blumenaviensis TaxID=1796055 RepID=A0AAV9VLB8_9PEZI
MSGSDYESEYDEGPPAAVGLASLLSGPSYPQDDDNGESVDTEHVKLFYGDIFAAPPNSVLIHACNCQGSWGAGIALKFRQTYPAAYSIYRDHCLSSPSPALILGTTLLIPPQRTDPCNHWIACMFTSVHFGRRVDPPEKILESTASAFEHLLSRVKNTPGGVPGALHACKINSGKFGVEWEKSRTILEDSLAAEGKDRILFVYEPTCGEIEREKLEEAAQNSKATGAGSRGRRKSKGGLGRGQQTLKF